MSSRVAPNRKTTGATAPTQFRLGEDILAKLDELGAAVSAATRTEMIRRLINDAHAKLLRSRKT
jgi:hypothetical protein